MRVVGSHGASHHNLPFWRPGPCSPAPTRGFLCVEAATRLNLREQPIGRFWRVSFVALYPGLKARAGRRTLYHLRCISEKMTKPISGTSDQINSHQCMATSPKKGRAPGDGARPSWNSEEELPPAAATPLSHITEP
jgi:hypothetical protein